MEKGTEPKQQQQNSSQQVWSRTISQACTEHVTYSQKNGGLRFRDWCKGRRFPLPVAQNEAWKYGRRWGEGRGLKGWQMSQNLPWVQPYPAPNPDALVGGFDHLSFPKKVFSRRRNNPAFAAYSDVD